MIQKYCICLSLTVSQYPIITELVYANDNHVPVRHKDYAKGQIILSSTHERETTGLLDPCCSTRCQSRMKTHLHDCCAEREGKLRVAAWQQKWSRREGKMPFLRQNSSHLPKRIGGQSSFVPSFSHLLLSSPVLSNFKLNSENEIFRPLKPSAYRFQCHQLVSWIASVWCK